MLRIGLHAREEDIMRELQSVRQTAGLILQRRKATAICLRKLSENATRLEDTQVQELKRQLKVMISSAVSLGCVCTWCPVSTEGIRLACAMHSVDWETVDCHTKHGLI